MNCWKCKLKVRHYPSARPGGCQKSYLCPEEHKWLTCRTKTAVCWTDAAEMWGKKWEDIIRMRASIHLTSSLAVLAPALDSGFLESGFWRPNHLLQRVLGEYGYGRMMHWICCYLRHRKSCVRRSPHDCWGWMSWMQQLASWWVSNIFQYEKYVDGITWFWLHWECEWQLQQPFEHLSCEKKCDGQVVDSFQRTRNKHQVYWLTMFDLSGDLIDLNIVHRLKDCVTLVLFQPFLFATQHISNLPDISGPPPGPWTVAFMAWAQQRLAAGWRHRSGGFSRMLFGPQKLRKLSSGKNRGNYGKKHDCCSWLGLMWGDDENKAKHFAIKSPLNRATKGLL
jgi:hypothetical protein